MSENLENATTISDVEKVQEAQEEAEVEVTEEVKKKKVDLKNVFMVVLDYLVIILAFMTSLMLVSEISFELSTLGYLNAVVRVTPFYAIGVALIMFIFRLYPADYKSIGVSSVRRLIIVSFFTSIAYFLIMENFVEHFPHVYYVLGGVLQFLLTSLIRFIYRLTHIKKGDK